MEKASRVVNISFAKEDNFNSNFCDWDADQTTDRHSNNNVSIIINQQLQNRMTDS